MIFTAAIAEARSTVNSERALKATCRFAFRALVVTTLMLGAVPTTGAAELSTQAPTTGDESPLIAYSLELLSDDSIDAPWPERNLKAAIFDLERHPPPPGAECAHTLGASRFAEAYENLATYRFELGEFEAAIEANEAALACTPRVASLHADIASLYLSLGRIAEARAALERGMAIDPDDRSLTIARARVEFLEQRWADATARFRMLATKKGDGEFARYYECFFWLAQRRAGVREPEPVLQAEDRDIWPSPILDTLTGRLTEEQLVERVRKDAARGLSARMLLTEALYYVGELRLAEGDVEKARRHFAAVVNLKVTSYVEYGMARSELAKLREPDSQ